MNISVTTLTQEDLQSVDDLGRRHRNTIGFLTAETFREYLCGGRVLGALTGDRLLIGYLMYADYPDRFRIVQLCVSEPFRGKGVARRLFNALRNSATTQKVIKLRCRRDFSANAMWPKLGFIPMDERPGRSSEGHALTLWCYRLTHDDELGLWKAETSDDVLDVVIDAHIFFDFDAEDTPNTLISKGLLNDFLVDSLNFWITDELFVEIDRQASDSIRRRSRERAHGMARLPTNQSCAEEFAEELKRILPYRREDEKSDVHHIAKTAASEVKTFVTKDDELIKRADKIHLASGVRIVHPTELITSLHQFADIQSYSPSRVSGMVLRWRRIRGEDCPELPTHALQLPSESKGKLLESIRYHLSHPTTYTTEVLEADGATVALRVLNISEEGRLKVPMARAVNSTNTELFGGFLVAHCLAFAVRNRREVVEFHTENTSESIRPRLINMGFSTVGCHSTRLVVSRICNKDDLLNLAASVAPAMKDSLETLSTLNVEHHCAPVVLDESLPCFLIPIKPAFAMGLIDGDQAAEDLFGGDPAILLRWDNVYYRAKTRHKMLRAPARILWYVSGGRPAIIGVSHLDEVEIGTPKDLFRKHKRFGVLHWRDLYKMCRGDISVKIMALRFSRTFPFIRRITLQKMREIFEEDGIRESLQSPSELPFCSFEKLFAVGFQQPCSR